MFRIGVIGCGKIAQVRHLPEYAANPDAKITGVYDLNDQRARDVAARYGAKAYEDCGALLDDPEIDAVSVCSSNATHARIACDALRHGKHVLCEKPMATTPEDCEEMARTAKSSGKLLMIDQNQRLTPAHQKARELIRAGAIGRVLTFRTSFCHSGPENWSVDPGKNTWFFSKDLAAMGVMTDLGVHKTDLIQFLLDQTVTEVTANLCTLDKRDAAGALIGVEDNAICIYRMSGGTVGTMTASWTHYCGEDNSTVLYGTEGEMRLYANPAHALILKRKNGQEEDFDLDAIQTNEHQTVSGVIDLFIACMKDRSLEGISPESVLPAMRAVFAGVVSAQEGRTVRV